jgi:hypothetical protein
MVASEPNKTFAANIRSASDARCCTTHPSSASCMQQYSEPGPLSLAHLGHLSTGRHAKSSSATRGTIRPAASQQLGPNEIKERTKKTKRRLPMAAFLLAAANKCHGPTPSPNSARAFRIPLVELWDMGATQIQTIPSYWEYASNSPKARPALPR